MAMFTKRRPLGEAGTAKSGGFGRTLGIILGVALIAILVMSCFTRVPTGNTGIVTTFGKVENYTLDAGMHFKLPWQKIVKMDNRVQKQSIDLMCFSSDIQEVSMTYTINYQISKADAMTIYSTIGINYYETVVIPCITESVKTVTARYTAEELVGMRSELASAIRSRIWISPTCSLRRSKRSRSRRRTSSPRRPVRSRRSLKLRPPRGCRSFRLRLTPTRCLPRRRQKPKPRASAQKPRPKRTRRSRRP